MKRQDIRALRDRLGESQSAFGDRFPVDRRTVIRWEAGEMAPSPMALQRMRELSQSFDEPTARSTPESESGAAPRRRGVIPSSA